MTSFWTIRKIRAVSRFPDRSWELDGDLFQLLDKLHVVSLFTGVR